MPIFRYAQYCPLARAAEVVGERWTILIVRELLLGPKRFSDLKRALRGVSASVLSERLARLEERDVIVRSEVAPPTPATLYTLTPSGLRLLPVVLELARWGTAMLGAREPGDHFEPEWLRLGCAAFVRKSPTPARTIAVRIAGAEQAEFALVGGEAGTEVRAGIQPADVAITLAADAPMTLFALASRRLSPAQAIESGLIAVEGDLTALEVLPELFDMAPAGTEPHPPQQGV